MPDVVAIVAIERMHVAVDAVGIGIGYLWCLAFGHALAESVLKRPPFRYCSGFADTGSLEHNESYIGLSKI